jgi:hypothetical protein
VPTARLPRFRIVWFLPAWTLLGLARLAILVAPFRAVARCCGADQGSAAWLPLVAPGHRGRARQVRDVVEAAARCTPWRSDCFPQALAAIALLRMYRLPYAMCLGLAHAQAGALRAHAWIDVGGVPVTGGGGFREFSIVACFVHDSA